MKGKFFGNSVLFLVFFFLTFLSPVFAANLKFEQTNIDANMGKNFDVKIMIDAGTDKVTSADAWIFYDSNLMEVGSSSIANGGYFQDIARITNNPGRVFVGGVTTEAGVSRTGAGTLAIISFKPKTTGSATLTFDCTEGVNGNDSGVYKDDVNTTDLIKCSESNTLKVNINPASGTSGASSPTPTIRSGGSAYPTSTYGGYPNGTGSADISELPRTGIFENVTKYSIPGVIMVVLGGLLLL